MVSAANDFPSPRRRLRRHHVRLLAPAKILDVRRAAIMPRDPLIANDRGWRLVDFRPRPSGRTCRKFYDPAVNAEVTQRIGDGTAWWLRYDPWVFAAWELSDTGDNREPDGILWGSADPESAPSSFWRDQAALLLREHAEWNHGFYFDYELTTADGRSLADGYGIVGRDHFRRLLEDVVLDSNDRVVIHDHATGLESYPRQAIQVHCYR